MLSDQELMTRISRGDTVAFGELYDRTSSHLFGLLISMVRERADAEDILQEAFMQVWRQADRYDPERATPLGWLVTIARSRAIDYFRRRGVAAQSELPESSVDPEMLRVLEQSESSARARQALGRLPIEQRTAIELAFFAGLTYEQVAVSQGLPVGTAKTRIRAGLQRLRDLLQESEGPEL